IILAGLLVGLGTRYGAGCTSGHGVCGLSRFSLRSAMATFCFMMAGFASVYVLRHLLGL
ncbi:YeeE/YedE family protein, partial [Herbaspirillum sp. B65]